MSALMFPAMLLLPLTVASPGAFDRALADAEPISSLGRFLARAVGDCEGSNDPGFDRRACRSRAKAVRSEYADRLLALELSDLRGRLTKPVWDPRRSAYRVLWTPLVGQGGLGLSVGRPRRLDRAGNPVVKRVPLWVPRPEGTPEFVFLRDLERGMVTLDVLVVLDRPWRLENRRGPPARGLSVKLRGWRLRTRRAQLAEHVVRR